MVGILPIEKPNLPPAGDEFPQEIDENIIRFAFQNIHGISNTRGLEVNPEIEMMSEWNISVMGMSETNRPWTAQQKSEYDFMMRTHFISSRTLYTAAPAISHDQTYQPGGNLMTINGHTTGRIYDQGSDHLGRFCWYALRGKRDEGVLVIVAYRVCQKASDASGPFTAYRQQYINMRNAGITNPNPRQQILKDLTTLITTKRNEGLRPILMMDANGDYLKGNDKELTNFIDANGLCDPFYEKFQISPSTYVHGSNRIDYILMDPALTGAIERIGYLGTHDGAMSDHVMAMVDVCEQKLFNGILNRPPVHHSREILIAQADKVEHFLNTVRPLLKEHEIQRRAFDLAADFVATGANDDLILKYHILYQQFLELSRGAAKKAGRKKFGYNRSSTLTHAAQMRLAYRKILDCKRRHTTASPALIRFCAKLSIDPDQVLASYTEQGLRRLVRKFSDILWECQKRGETYRVEWIQTLAQNYARITGDPNWEAKMKSMIRTTEQNAVNRTLSMITKGRRGVLDRIQIPTHHWFYSASKAELYHYDVGVFEAYPMCEDGTFYRHHTLKVPASDVILVNVDIDQDTNRWTITETLPTPPTMWVDVTSQTEIERALLARNKRHLQQTAREEGISTRPPLATLKLNDGFNDMSTAILNGTSLTSYDITPEMAHFFHALKRTNKDRQLPPIVGDFTTEDIQNMFKTAKERTSSDSRTLNYTLWKCLAKDDNIAGMMSVLFSLPFMYGFVNTHWVSMTDFMLEKKPGVRHIHTLRIIGKLAAEFNTCLKYLIGKKTRDNYESTDTSDDQHGFRPNRSSVDAAMLKVLTFESARMQKCTVATMQHDMTAHFDRMYPHMTAILGTKYGVDDNILKCINKTIGRLRRNVETALGVSDDVYNQNSNEPFIGGLVQGKADVPQWSTQQTDAMLKAHKAMTTGLCIHSPNMSRVIQHSNISFADDTDGQESQLTTEIDAISTVVANLQHNAQKWSNLVQICGGLIALHKCNWQLIAWELNAGHLKMVHSTTERLVMDDGNGSFATIDFLPPNQPNVGLGYRICPNGDQSHHFKATKAAISQLCKQTSGAYLSEAEARQMLTQRLIPKLTYALNVSSFSVHECNRINSDIRQTFLPITRLNRHFPSAVLYGPQKYGGLEFPEVNALQDRIQLEYLIKQLRWDKSVANSLLVTLDNVQLCSGLSKPLLEHTYPSVEYLDASYIIDLRQRLRKIQASLWIEQSWVPKLQRVGDEALMDRFTAVAKVTRAQLRQCNAVRLYLRVVTISDLSDITGEYIPSEALQGDWQAGSSLMWPYQPRPPKSFFATFRKLLRKTFCSNTPIHHYHKDSMDLDYPLGEWLPVERNTWSTAYRSKDTVYWRPQDDWDLYVLTRSSVSGFYHYSHTTRDLPLDSHPIKFQQVGESIWTQRPYRMREIEDGTTLPPGHIVANTLSDPSTEILTIGSDGSVYLKEEVAACAWMIAADDNKHVTACFLMGKISSLSSYRSELEGIYRSLKHVQYLGMSPREIQHWCDNESAVDDSNRPLSTPSAMGKPDADLLLAIHHIREVMATNATIICRHIYGHQDTRDRGVPLVFRTDTSLEIGDLGAPIRDGNDDDRRQRWRRSLPVVTNIEADRIASETTSLARGDINQSLPIVMTLPYTGSRALLRVHDTWVTSHMDRMICNAHWESTLVAYCKTKYLWTDDVFATIDWLVIGAARKKCTKTQLMQTSKIIHDWLPVMHMQGHMTGNRQCPACAHPDETLDHLLQCPHPSLVRIRKDTLATAMKKGQKLGIHRNVLTALCHLLREYFTGETYEPTNDTIQKAVTEQRAIGIQYLPRGILTMQWRYALDSLNCDNSDRKIASFLFIIWTEIVDTIWRARNDIVHHSNNLNRQADASRIDRCLRWYGNHYRDVLARQDFKLVDYGIDDLYVMTLASKRERLRQLDLAKKAHDIEINVRAGGQNAITQYFAPKGEVQTKLNVDGTHVESATLHDEKTH